MAAEFIQKNKIYIAGTRLPFASASVIPSLLGAVWGWVYRPEKFNFVDATLATLGVLFLHLAANTINDYFDWDESDRINRFPTPFSGGSRFRMEKFLSKKSFLLMSLVLSLFAIFTGIFLVFHGKPLVLFIGGLGALCGFLYSVRPFSFQSRGMGEFLIFFAFGPLITLGMGYAATGQFDIHFFLIGIPSGLATTNILWVNEFPDYEADSISGKRNLVVRLGTAKARFGYISLHLFFFISWFVLLLMKYLPVWSLIVLLSLPLAVKAVRGVWKEHSNPHGIVPAQASTIMFQMISGILLILSIFLDKFV